MIWAGSRLHENHSRTEASLLFYKVQGIALLVFTLRTIPSDDRKLSIILES